MSKPLDISVTHDDFALRVGRLVLQIWQQEKQIQVLGERVDELDPPEAEKEPEKPVEKKAGKK